MAADTSPSRLRAVARAAKHTFEVLLVALAVLLVLLWASVPDDVDRLRDGRPRTTAFIELRRTQARAAGRSFQPTMLWRDSRDLSGFLWRAVVLAEDVGFFRHDGVDWSQTFGALQRNVADGNLAMGGSTITQQLAKNLYLSPDRSGIRKLREFLIASRLEQALSKRRILTLYLNVVEWSDGVFGAEAAAQHWFHTTAAELSPAQAVRLAVVLPAPLKRNPTNLSSELTEHAESLLKRLHRGGYLTDDEFALATVDLTAPSR